MERSTWSCDSLRAGSNNLRKKNLSSKVIWACPQVTWSMLIWRTCITQFFPLASSLHFLPPLLTLPPTAEATPANYQWLSATAAVGARDAGTSRAQVSSFFFNLFFGFTNDFFTIRLCVCELRQRWQTHAITKHWNQQGLETHHASSPQVHFFFLNAFFFIHLTMTYS